MSWQEVVGHDRVIEKFRQAVQRGRLASTFLFVGPEGIGKRTFAIKLAQALLCETNEESKLEPCGTCEACRQVLAGNHPDLEAVGKPADRQSIPLDVFIGDKEHRNREGLCHRISLKPVRGRRKVAIIDDADYLNVEGANCLLKTLEEPPPGSVIILIGTSQQRQLPTIRSRCQVIRFRPLADDDLRRLLLDKELVPTEQDAAALIAVADGSLVQAIEGAEPEMRQFREQLVDALSARQPQAAALVAMIGNFVDQAGKEAALRRARLRQVIAWASEFYRQRLRAEFRETEMPASVDQTVSRIDRCMDAETQVSSNANQATLIECWVDDLLH